MPILRNLLMLAAQRVASDPEIRAKAETLYKNKVKPGAKVAWQQTKPVLANFADKLEKLTNDSDEDDTKPQPNRKG